MALTATQLAAQVRAGEMDPVTVTEEALAKIAAADRLSGAFRVVRSEAALAEAAALRARPDLADLPLAGVPVAVKDVVAVAGERITNGSGAASEDVAQEDHVVVRRLRAAGAIIVGITRVPELCIWPTCDDPEGMARNPWQPERTAGGSSGGSGAAVASGLVPIAHGTDGMGSIRLPAAICGLVGIKPGFGVVDVPELNTWFGMSAHGPLATTVADAALLLSVLAERPELAEVREPVAPMRIGVSTRAPLGMPVQRPIRAAVNRAANLLADAGHQVDKATPGYGMAMAIGMTARWLSGPAEEAAGLDRAMLQRRTRRHIGVGAALRRAGLIRPRTARRWAAEAAVYFEEHDVLLTPAFASRPPKARRWHERGWLPNVVTSARFAPFTGPWNLAGFPALSVPGGRDAEGNPIGLQLVAPPGGESLLIGVAAHLERINPWPVAATPYPDSSREAW